MNRSKKHPKLDFSKQGFHLLTSHELWNERRQLVEQIYQWFGEMLTELKSHHNEQFKQLLPSESLNGKITRGDNYKAYPYLLLDYPNHFSKDKIVAARNLIWFGNGFYCTLHIRSNDRFDKLSAGLVENVITKFFDSSNRFKKVYVCISDNEWIHDINKTTWYKMKDVTLNQLEDIKRLGWIKLGIKLSIDKPDKWENDLVEVYKTWSELVN